MTGDWFNWTAKLLWLETTLRDRWRVFDVGALVVTGLLLFFSVVDKRLSYSRNLAASTIFLVAVFILLPRAVFGSAYADMRPDALYVRDRHRRHPFPSAGIAALRRTIAMLGLVFFGARTIGTTASFAIASRNYDRALGALDHVPYGARLVSFVGVGCKFVWVTTGWSICPVSRSSDGTPFERSMGYGRRSAADQPLSEDSRHFHGDPSELVTAGPCPRDKWRSLDLSFQWMPRDEFDYIWLIDPAAV